MPDVFVDASFLQGLVDRFIYSCSAPTDTLVLRKIQ